MQTCLVKSSVSFNLMLLKFSGLVFEWIQFGHHSIATDQSFRWMLYMSLCWYTLYWEYLFNYFHCSYYSLSHKGDLIHWSSFVTMSIQSFTPVCNIYIRVYHQSRQWLLLKKSQQLHFPCNTICNNQTKILVTDYYA